MTLNDLVLFALVAAGAFYLGYQFGRLKTLAERGGAQPYDGGDAPLPGPLDRPYSESSQPVPRRAAPPPASAGDDGSWQEAGDRPVSRMPPRRSTKPPPAAAGLMGTGEAEKSGKRQK